MASELACLAASLGRSVVGHPQLARTTTGVSRLEPQPSVRFTELGRSSHGSASAGRCALVAQRSLGPTQLRSSLLASERATRVSSGQFQWIGH